MILQNANTVNSLFAVFEIWFVRFVKISKIYSRFYTRQFVGMVYESSILSTPLLSVLVTCDMKCYELNNVLIYCT